MTNREVVLIDMDCFYVQVEQRLNPSLKGKPCVVVQYKTYRGGGIIAVGYEARACGVTRNMCGDEAKEKCPEVQLARVPEVRGKADLTRYREAGAEVIAVFSKFCSCVERASVDEAFLDLSDEVTRRLKAMGDSQVMKEQIQNTFVEGYNGLKENSEWLKKVYSNPEVNQSECRLAVAAGMVEEMRAAVLKETGFTCSAGIANNKMLAKLACGRNKPNKQTVLPMSSVKGLFEILPLQKIRHLGGKLGAFLTDDLGLKTMWDLTRFSEQDLQKHCGLKTGSWLYNACRGVETEAVATRVLPKSIGCSKNFRGREMLDTKEKVKFWLSELSQEVSERLNKDKELNKRIAKSLTVSVYYKTDSGSASASRACALVRYDAEKISSDAYNLLQQFNTCPGHSTQWSPPLRNLGLSASKFTENGAHPKINSMFLGANSSQTASATTKLTASFASMHDETPSEHARNDFSSNSKLVSTSANESSDFQTENIFAEKFTEPISTNSKYGAKPTCLKNSQSVIPKNSLNSNVDEKPKGIAAFFTQVKASDKNVETKESCSEKLVEDGHRGTIDKPSNGNEVNSKQNKSIGFFARKIQDCVCERSKSSILSANVSGSNSQISSSNLSVNTDITKIIKDDSENSKVFQEEELIDTTENSFYTTEPACNNEVLKSRDEKVSKSSNNLATNDDFMECDKCGEFISVWEMPEHNDFHFALDLQKEANLASTSRISNQTSTTSSRTSLPPATKHKPSNETKTRGGGKKRKIDKSVQPLTAFFSKT